MNNMAKSTTSFRIQYTFQEKGMVDNVETTLVSEGWKKTNYTYPSEGVDYKPTEIFVSWFEREWYINLEE